MGNERTPWRTPLRSKLICAAFAAVYSPLVVLLSPVMLAVKCDIVLLLAFSPTIQLIRVPVIKRILKSRVPDIGADNAAWTDWFVSLFTASVSLFLLADYLLRIGSYHWGESYSVGIPAVSDHASWTMLFIMGYGNTTLGAVTALILASLVVDVIVVWSFSRFKQEVFRRSLGAALAANLAALCSTVAFIVLLNLLLVPYLWW